MFQLQGEIKRWTASSDNSRNIKKKKKNSNDNHICKRRAEIYAWIKPRIKLIYFMTFVSGSSFSTIALFNSYLFKLDVFSMGLTRKQRAIFQNKRIFSVVLLEVEYNPQRNYTK